MEKRRLGNTELFLSEIGFGCASVWGKHFYDEKEAMDLFFNAFENGVTYFDTGSVYGLAEERLGKCLSQLSGNERQNLVISTKCGTHYDESGKIHHDWNIDKLQKSVIESLKKLQTSYIDMLHLHGPDISDINDDVLSFLNDLKSKGTVRTFGINTFDTKVIEYIASNNHFDFVMLDYNIMRKDREPLIEKLYKNDIGVLAGAALAQSLFSNRVFRIKNKKDLWYLLRALKNFRGHMINGFYLRFLENDAAYTGSQLALRYVLDNSYITSAVFGTTSKEHLLENLQATGFAMPENIREKIEIAQRRIKIKGMDR